LADRSFAESFRIRVTFDTSRLSPVEVARLAHAAIALGSTYTGVARFVSVQDFQTDVSTPHGRFYVRAANGAVSMSRDGLHYRAVPAAAVALVSNMAQASSVLTHHLTAITDQGPRVVEGATVEQYSATLPASVIGAEIGSLTQIPAHLAFSKAQVTVVVDRSTGLPVRLSDTMTEGLELANRPEISGVLVARIVSTRSFSHFVAVPYATSNGAPVRAVKTFLNGLANSDGRITCNVLASRLQAYIAELFPTPTTCAERISGNLFLFAPAAKRLQHIRLTLVSLSATIATVLTAAPLPSLGSRSTTKLEKRGSKWLITRSDLFGSEFEPRPP
jgi:hypothetical protein